MKRTTFEVEKMDCSAEEQRVRMQLEDVDGIHRLTFDLPNRRVAIYHSHNREGIESALQALALDARLVESEEVSTAGDEAAERTGAEPAAERRPLLVALGINAGFFVAELAAGFLAGSMGLVADSLDMLADAIVYALSLMAVGAAVSRKNQIARWSGYFQFGLAVLGLSEVLRRFLMAEGVPDVATMIGVAALALLGNVATLLILHRARRGEAHVEASWIFTSNDIKVNGLVILSGGLVYLTGSRIPDLLAGGFIFLIVARGAWQILSLAPTPERPS